MAAKYYIEISPPLFYFIILVRKSYDVMHRPDDRGSFSGLHISSQPLSSVSSEGSNSVSRIFCSLTLTHPSGIGQGACDSSREACRNHRKVLQTRCCDDGSRRCESSSQRLSSLFLSCLSFFGQCGIVHMKSRAIR